MLNILSVDKFDLYRNQIRAALRELAAKGEQRKEIDREMVNLRQLIRANANMLPDEERKTFITQVDDTEPAGFTETIRRLLRDRREGFTPLELRGAMAEAGIDLSTQSNAMASIHSVLKRLEASGDVQSKPGPDGQTLYQWSAKGAYKDALQRRTLRRRL